MKYEMFALLISLFSYSISFTQEDKEITFILNPAISPDGKIIVFTFQGDLWSVPLEGGKAEKITNTAEEEWDCAWSHDGHCLAFSSMKDGNLEIFTLDLRTHQVNQLTFHAAHDRAPAWSADDSRIYFMSNRDSNFDLPNNENVSDIFWVSRDGGTPQRVTKFGGENPALSHDGKLVAFNRYSSGYGEGEPLVAEDAVDQVSLRSKRTSNCMYLTRALACSGEWW